MQKRYRFALRQLEYPKGLAQSGFLVFRIKP